MTLKGDVQSSPEFSAWREGIYQVSRCDKTYMKLSGCFSEIPQDFAGDENELFALLQPWLAVVLAAFGPFRILFGSDWPVCTVGGVKDDAWKKWVWVVERMCDLGGLTMEEQVMLWSGTAIKAYGIQELM
jgi:L-rhamnono-1,4-lactonase